MEKLQKSMNIYMKAISKRAEIEDKEKTLPVAHLGGTMISHGEDFELDSEFGQCMTGEFITLLPWEFSYSSLTILITSLWEDAGANCSCSRKLHHRCYNQL